jgi:hypothetical protein
MNRKVRNRVFDEGNYEEEDMRSYSPNKNYPLSYNHINYPGVERSKSPPRNRLQNDMETPIMKRVDQDSICK